MKRYLVFACDCYYPSGGWDDFVGHYDTLEDAVVAGVNARNDMWEVIDRDTQAKVDDSYTKKHQAWLEAQK